MDKKREKQSKILHNQTIRFDKRIKVQYINKLRASGKNETINIKIKAYEF